jgi:hypothetical protein
LKKLKEAKKTMKKEELDIMDGKMKIPKWVMNHKYIIIKLNILLFH